MPDTTLSQAIKEAYATKPEIVIYHTLEFSHPSLANSIRVVQGFHDITAEGQNWQAVPFELVLPEVTELSPPNISIKIDAVAGYILEAIETIAATMTNDPIKVTYRAFLETAMGAPANQPPLSLSLSDISVNEFSVTATASLSPLNNRKWPRRIYTDDDFPGLLSVTS